MAVLGAVLSEEPAPPRRAGSLAPLLWHLLRKEPSARPGAEEVRRVLRDVSAGRPSGFPGPGPVGPVAVRRGPRRVWIPIAAGVAVVAAGALIVTAVALNASDDDARVASDSAPAESATAQAAAPSATPSPSASAGPDLCGLLTRQQVRRLIPRGEPEVEKDETSCGWAAAKRGFSISDLGRSSGGAPPRSSVEAHNRYVSTKNTSTPGIHYWGWPEIDVNHVKARQTGAQTISGIGDEAFAYTSTGLSKPMDVSAVVFRVDDTVLRVEHMYERGTASPAEAREAARWIARAARP